MLVNFRFRNCRSFYEEAELSLRSTTDESYRELNTFTVKESVMTKGDNELLKSAIIFGGNASGKSNVLKAFTYMVNVVRLSSAQIPIVSSNESFAFKEGADKEGSLYETEFIQNGRYYKYGFVLINGTVESEWLYKREVRLTCVFKRQNDKLEILGETAQSIKLIKVPKASLFLSIGNNFNLNINKYLNDVMEWFLKVLIVFENASNSLDIYTFENGKYKTQALDILSRADIGIEDIDVIKDKIAVPADPDSLMTLNAKLQSNPSIIAGQLQADNEGLYSIDMKTVFPIFNEQDDIVGKKDVMLFKENGFNSEGTVRLLCYLGWILAALNEGRVILIDEIDSKLHFLVADYILKLFNSIEFNPQNAQLVCTAHNVMLMDDGFRRDQIYFTSKDSFGRSSLVSLADYTGVRKTDLFSKKYLAGFYAAIPDMERGRG
ncbi:MAG: ATP-binding protein [Paludibacteraceae bacterium]|nr:ATP-binding protein [Paludibacteraceae bacterium]